MTQHWIYTQHPTLGENVVDDHDIYMRKKTQMRNDATKTKGKE